MVGIQALGFSISLTTGAGYFYFHATSNYIYYCGIGEGPSPLFGILINVILLLACISTIGLFQTVWKSRLRLAQVPCEKRVLISCAVIYAICFLTEIYASIDKAPSDSHSNCRKHAVRPYVGLIQDFFFLPQVIWISEWKYSGKSVRKVYYIGLTALYLFPQMYDYANSGSTVPIVPFDGECHSERGSVRVGSAVALLLVAVVYLRQSGSNYRGAKINMPLKS